MKRALVLLLLLAVPFPPSARAASTRAFVITSDFSSGSLSVIDLATRTVSQDVATVHSDAVARWFDGKLYVLNRLGQDNVQVLDPSAGYATVRQFSVGNGSNPQDIAFVSPTKAYVSRLGSADLLIVNPQTGASTGSIPLAAWADADGNPEPARMFLANGRLFVALQCLTNFQPDDTSYVVVIDAAADTVIDVDPSMSGRQAIALPARNPVTTFLPKVGVDDVFLYVGCAGAYGVQDGGVAEIVVQGFAHGSPTSVFTTGLVTTEVQLGGDVGDLALYGDHSYAIVSDASFNTHLVTWSLSTGEKLDTIWSPGGFSLSDLALNDRQELYVANSSFAAPGVHVFRAWTDEPLAGPLDTGLPPSSITFDREEGLLAVPPASAPATSLSLSAPSPNPCRSFARMSLTLARSGHANVDIFDLAGRRLSSLVDRELPAGTTDLTWGTKGSTRREAAPGVFFVRARFEGETVTRRLVVID